MGSGKLRGVPVVRRHPPSRARFKRASRWYVRGQIGWILEDVEPLLKPVPARGMLGLWTVPATLRPRVRRVHRQ